MAMNYAQFPKLGNSNYHVWKFNMELLLLERELWDVVSGDTPSPSGGEDAAKWLVRDGKARAAIGLAVEESQKVIIKQLKTSKEFWDALKKHHEKANITNKVSLLRQMSSMRFSGSRTMEDHIADFLSIVDRLRDLGETVEDHKAVAFLLGTLSEEYNNVISSLEMRPEADLTLDLVKEKLLQEYKRKCGGEQADTAFKTQKKKFVPKCYSCGKPGHMKRDCPKLNSYKQKQNDNRAHAACNDEHACFGISDMRPNGEWYVDSAATCHMCCKEEYFVNINKNIRNVVYLADGKELKTSGAGDCEVFCEGRTITIKNVLFVPELDGSLLSVRKLTNEGFDVVFKSGGCSITRNGSVYAKAILKHNLFVLEHKELAKKVSCSAECLHTWHRRLGHRNLQSIKTAVNKNIVDGIELKKCSCVSECEVCLRAKLTRQVFPKKSETKSKGILDLVHCDLCGPMQNETPSGNKYFMTLIDDYSRYCTLYFLSSKDQAFEKIKEFIEMCENQYGKRLKVLRTDRGGEFVNKRMKNYFKRKGIVHQLTAPYTPEQNGVAERRNRSLVEMGRCMLFDADFELKYWAEAVNNANYIQNRMLSAAVDVTPFELWSGKPPNLSHIRMFGCVAYAHINKQKRQKLDDVAEKYNLVGYCEHSKAYRLLDMKTNKIVISRDVKFLEQNEFSAGTEKKELVDENVVYFPSPELNEVSSVLSEEEDFYGFESNNSDTSSEVERVEEIPRNVSADGHRVSSRVNKGIPAKKYGYKVYFEDDPVTYEEAMSRPDREQWLKAMKSEMKALNKNETWDLVELPKGQKTVGSKWVFKLKETANGEKKYKTRFVAKGFSQKYGENYDEIFAPVVKQSTIRSLLAIASNQGMKVKHIDIKTAFLYGELDAEIYVDQPEGFALPGNEHLVCKLKRSLYGLKQSARCWNLRINKILIDSGFRRGKAEPCLYVKGDGDSIIYVLIYVDDIIVATKNDIEFENVVKVLKSNFEITEMGDLKLYLGIEVNLEDGVYYLSQERYIDKLIKEFGLENAKVSSIPMDPGYLKNGNGVLFENNNLYRKAIGSLLYISNNTRPDISLAVSILSRKVSCPTDVDWVEVKRVLRYLKGTRSMKMCVGSKSDLMLTGYADADWAGDINGRKSTSGYVFKLGDAVVSYASRKQSNVTLSSTEAEYVALAEASQELLWLVQLMKEFKLEIETPKVFEDNQSCLKILQDEKVNPRSKHIDVKYYFVRDLCQSGAVVYEYCPTESMVADILTKPLQKLKICSLRNLIGLSN